MKKNNQNIIKIKKDIYKYIEKIQDDNLLKTIYLILTSTKINDINDEKLRNELTTSINEANSGQLISHKEALEQIKAKIDSL